MNKYTDIVYPYVWHDEKPFPLSFLLETLSEWREAGKKVVTTNGCFDLLHAGHVHFLNNARNLGDVLIVGLNSDTSVNELKGVGRPILPESERATLLASLRAVALVVVFDELLPTSLLDMIKPDIHCKAADYTIDKLPEAELVKQHGGEIVLLPMLENISTSRLIERINIIAKENEYLKAAEATDLKNEEVLEYFSDINIVLNETRNNLGLKVISAADSMVKSLLGGNKILICGNGGSASDAQHMAAELVGRFKMERDALPAIALSADTAVLTALSNDFGFEQVFSRQISALGKPGDILIAISTSGLSPNILEAVKTARETGLYVIGLSGNRGGNLADESDLCLSVHGRNTEFIQLAHHAILHLLCGLVEKHLPKKVKSE
jgi:D-sedoheptulose 7-phosphate isomerase